MFAIWMRGGKKKGCLGDLLMILMLIWILMTLTTVVMKVNSLFVIFKFYFCKHLWLLRLCWWWRWKWWLWWARCFVQVLLLQPFAVVATNRPKPSIFEAPSDAKTANFSTGSCSSFLFCFWECLFPCTKWLLWNSTLDIWWRIHIFTANNVEMESLT